LSSPEASSDDSALQVIQADPGQLGGSDRAGKTAARRALAQPRRCGSLYLHISLLGAANVLNEPFIRL
jgi:hypothetical protein